MSTDDLVGGVLATGSTPPFGIAATQSVASVAALRALTSVTLPIADGSIIETLGYNTPGDGGAARYRYVASDSSSLDNSATIFVDATTSTKRRWYLIWDGVHFQAAWAGILTTNTDNGQLLARVPYYCECWFESGVYQFVTYPSQFAFSCKLWRGLMTIWNCTGPIGTGSEFNLGDIAFNWVWVSPYPAIQGLGYASGQTAADMGSAGVSPIEGIGIISQLGTNSGVGLALGQAPVATSSIGQVRSTTSHATGKVHFEVTVNTGATAIGFASIAHSIGVGLGSDSTSLAYTSSGNIFAGGSEISIGYDTYVTAPCTIAIEIDFDAQRLWTCNVTTNPTVWNNGAQGPSDPAAGTGGISFQVLPGATQYFAALEMDANGDQGTVNFGATPFARAASSGFSAWGSGVTLDPAAQINISLSNGNLTGTTSGIASLPGDPNFADQYFIRPKNFSVGGFYVLVSWANAFDSYLTGLENVVLKGCFIGIYYSNTSGGPTGSGENFSFIRCDFNHCFQDAFQIYPVTLSITFDGCSFDYNNRNGFADATFSGITIAMKNCYNETEVDATPNELYAINGWVQLSIDSSSVFNGYTHGYSAASMFAFGGVGVAQVQLNKPMFYDEANRQFINTSAADNIFGSVVCAAINNSSMWVPAVSPGNLINPDWNFASGGLTFYPGSSGCTNQTSVVHSPQTNAVAMVGNALLPFATMDVNPGEVICMSMYDKASGQLAAVGGSVIFETADGITVATESFATTTPIPLFANSALAPGFTAASRDWTLEQFAFRVPSGASKMTGNLTSSTAVSLDPSATGPSITLSNSNLTATMGANVNSLTKGTSSETTGKFFASFTVTTSGGASVGAAIVNAFINSALGIDTNSLAYRPGGTIVGNNSVIATIASYTSGDVVDMALDLTDQEVWFRVNGGNWNNSGTANPATNTGGISTSSVFLTVGAFPAIGLSATGAAVTINLGGTSYTFAAPSGFSNWPGASGIYYVSELEMHR